MRSKPVVFLHGFTGHADCWVDVMARDRERPAFAYTLLGHDWDRPASEEPPPSSSFEGEVERIAALIRRDCPEKASLCGYSQGGRVALVLLVRYPELFASAVLVSASPGLESGDERNVRASADARWIELLEREGVTAFMDAWQAQPLFASQHQLPPSVQLDQRRRRCRHRADGLALALRSLGLARMPNMWPELRPIAVPVHLVVGELDPKFHAIAERMRAEMPTASLHVVEGAGHNIVLERPDALAAVLAHVDPDPR